MRRICLWLTLVILIVMAQLIATAPMRNSLRAQINPNYVRAMVAYRKLQPRLPRQELRAITAIGILNGAREAERKMEQHLVEVVKDLLLNTDMTDDELLSKIERIEKQLTRDHRALTILTGAMDLVTGARDVRDFKADMQQALQQIRRQSNVEEQREDGTRDGESEEQKQQHEEEEEKDLSARVATLRRNILEQVNAMKALVEQKIEQTLDYLIDEADENGVLAKASNKIVRKRDAGTSEEREVPARVRMMKSILTEDDFRNNLVDADPKQQNDLFDSLEEDLMPQPAVRSKNVIANRSSSRTTTSITTTTTKAKPTRKTAALTDEEATTATTTAEGAAESVATTPDLYETELAHQEEESSSEVTPEDDGAAAGGGGGGGGLVALISNLSGGEGGSDIGALIGALTGVISNLFGPNGLDIESLISTSTSLISGLLAGNKNFGTVLGQYVGTAFDGLSGGGGAVNNGQFIGNFLGTVVASLSADPEEDDGPLRPLQFAQNVISSFWEAKNRKASEEETEERKSHTGHGAHSTHSTHSSTSTHHKGGSDSGGFIKQIVSHLVGSAVSLILNASLGAVAGTSHASTSLFTGSSHKHGGGAAAGGDGGGKTW